MQKKLAITKRIENLKVNGGFLVKDCFDKSRQIHICKTAKRLGFKIVTKTTDKGLRVWRYE